MDNLNNTNAAAPAPALPANTGDNSTNTVVPAQAAEAAPQSVIERYQQYYTPDPADGVTDPNKILVETIQSLKDEIASLKTSRSGLPSEVPATGWLELVRQGKVAEAEVMVQQQAAEAAVKIVEDRMSVKLSEMSRQQTEQSDLTRQIEKFNADLLRENPDLSEMEPLIAARVRQRLENLPARPKTARDYFSTYISAVSSEVEFAKQYVQRIRGAGKAEAQTRTSQVLATQSVTGGNDLARRDSIASNNSAEPDIGAGAFIAERQNRMRAIHGLLNRQSA